MKCFNNKTLICYGNCRDFATFFFVLITSWESWVRKKKRGERKRNDLESLYFMMTEISAITFACVLRGLLVYMCVACGDTDTEFHRLAYRRKGWFKVLRLDNRDRKSFNMFDSATGCESTMCASPYDCDRKALSQFLHHNPSPHFLFALFWMAPSKNCVT